MSSSILFLALLCSSPIAHADARQVETVPYEELGKFSISDSVVNRIAMQSKVHVMKSSEGQIYASELELLDVQLVIENTTVADLPQPSPEGQAHCATCSLPATLDPLPPPGIRALPTPVSKKKRFIYITWGYNRGFHSNSDATFKTASGTFTIHDAVGHDRQSTELLDYIHPERIPIPQYNLKIGYEVNENWDIVAGLDHMKCVFQNDRKYEVSGD